MSKFIGYEALYKLLDIIKNQIDMLQSKIGNHTPISRSTTITESGKYALDAIEKNASINGTLANQINKLSTSAYKNGINIYISDSGNDSNDGLTAAKPIKTLNKLKTFNYESVVLRIVNKLTISGTCWMNNVIRINSATTNVKAILNMSAQANIHTNGKLIFEDINITGSLLTVQAAAVLLLRFQFTSPLTLYECDAKLIEITGSSTLTLANAFAIFTGVAGFTYPISVVCINAIIAADINVAIPNISGERARIQMVT